MKLDMEHRSIGSVQSESMIAILDRRADPGYAVAGPIDGVAKMGKIQETSACGVEDSSFLLRRRVGGGWPIMMGPKPGRVGRGVQCEQSGKWQAAATISGQRKSLTPLLR
jgi:hypothetical protein